MPNNSASVDLYARFANKLDRRSEDEKSNLRSILQNLIDYGTSSLSEVTRQTTPVGTIWFARSRGYEIVLIEKNHCNLTVLSVAF